MCTGPNQPPEPEQTPFVVSADLFRAKAQEAIKHNERVKVRASGWTLKEVQHHKLVVIKRKVMIKTIFIRLCPFMFDYDIHGGERLVSPPVFALLHLLSLLLPGFL